MFGQLVNETTLPVRKRRRPALSCVECRRRKIKCDRNYPCNHCKTTKNSNCVYHKDPHSQANRRLSPTSLATGSLRSNIDTSPQLVNNEAFDSSYQYALYVESSHPTSPVLGSWSDSGKVLKVSYPPTVATTVDDSPQSVDDQILAYKRNERSLPDAMTTTVEEVKSARWQEALGISFSTFNDVIVEDGTSSAKIRTKFFNRSDSTPIKDLKGCMSKTRFFGQSHWMSSFDEQFQRMRSFAPGRDIVTRTAYASETSGMDEANKEVRRLLEHCKIMTRKIKAERSVKWHLNPDLNDYLPARELGDKLVNLYLRTMESTHRILHIPQFLREYEQYWANPGKASTRSAVKILLVMAIGSTFYQEADSETVRATAQQWVYSAQAWVSAPFEKGRLNLSGLQVHCLLMIARQTAAVGGDLLWVAAGDLIRNAFQMGFHRDPKWFPKISILHGELRRRLWATVLEFSIQVALNSGMPPLISVADFDTSAPANLNDEDLTESTSVLPPPKPMSVYTQSSLQIQMLKSMPTRLHIANLLNDFRSELTYDTALSLGTSISQSCNEASLLVSSYPPHLPHPTALQRNCLDILLRRFLIAVHRPFAIKSQTDPRYYFSRKVCTDASLIIMSHSGRETPTSPPPVDDDGNEIMDDYTRLRGMATGVYREIIFQAGLLVCLELILQLEEDHATGLPPSATNAVARAPLKKAVENMALLSVQRLELGENNAKCLLFVEAARGQIEAMERGELIERGIVEAARRAARRCLGILRRRLGGIDGVGGNGVLEEDKSTGNGIEEGNGNQGESLWQTAGAGGGDSGDVARDEYEYDFTMQDDDPGLSNFNFDIPDSWLFAGWGVDDANLNPGADTAFT